jgi:primase-polymerase (primpol)-like protein
VIILPAALNEMKGYSNWVAFKFTKPDEAGKRGKIPYNILSGHKASTMNMWDWTTYENAVNATGYDGIGFVLSKSDPFLFIDLDDPHGDEKAYKSQQLIYKEFNSYTEYSPSGKGIHIIAKGAVPHGVNKRRHHVEIYSDSRFMTMTGNVLNDKPPENRHELANELWRQLGGQDKDVLPLDDSAPERETDEEILSRLVNDKYT